MKISVALCTYNGEGYIRHQLNSILNQDVKVDEIVVCDDGSTDNTVDIVKGILSKAGIYHRVEVNKPSLGVANNFLKALKLTSGDYVFTCDQDDVWNKDKVKIFLEKAEKTKKDLYFSNGILIDSDGNPLGNTLWNYYNINYDVIIQTPLINTLVGKSLVTGAAMMVSRKLIDSIDNIPKNWLHDEWFAIVAALQNSISPINEMTFGYRQHGNNVVGAKKQTLSKKIKIWVSNFKNLKQIHRVFYERSSDIYNLAKSTEYTETVYDAYLFWKTLVDVEKLGRIKGMLIVTKMFLSGKYSKFYTGLRGFVRDVISIVFF